MAQPRKRATKKVTPEPKPKTEIPVSNLDAPLMSEVASLRAALKYRADIMDEMRQTIVDLEAKTAPIEQKMEKAVEKVMGILGDFEYQEGVEILTKARKHILRQAEDKARAAEKAMQYFGNLRSL